MDSLIWCVIGAALAGLVAGVTVGWQVCAWAGRRLILTLYVVLEEAPEYHLDEMRKVVRSLGWDPDDMAGIRRAINLSDPRDSE